jgi:diacylglycerol kinase family enzyme
MADPHRLILIVNPRAQSVTPDRTQEVAEILGGAFQLTRAFTHGPGHATELAHKAAYGDAEVVAVLGGDGTINEAANALAGTRVPLGVLPGGGADVFARSIGIPTDPSVAARLLVERAAGILQARTVPLGRVVGSSEGEGRFFVANCGVGFDAAIVRAVERHPRAKRRFGDWSFVGTGLQQFFFGYDRRRPRLELSWGAGADQRQRDLFLAILQNTTPYTFLGRRPLRLCPDATLEGGLDCFAVATMRTRVILPLLLQTFRSGVRTSDPRVTSLHDLRRLRIGASVPMPMQVDGEFIDERTELVVESVPEGLCVIAPAAGS